MRFHIYIKKKVRYILIAIFLAITRLIQCLNKFEKTSIIHFIENGA